MDATKEERKGLAPGWWITIVVAVITAIGGPIVNGYFKSKPPTAATVTSDTKKTTTFTGLVSDDANKPIVGATVFDTQDQNPGEGQPTDAYGQFQIEIAPEIKALRLTVSATGFITKTIVANIHRTFPEPIVLVRAPSPPISQGLRPPPSQAKPKQVTVESRPTAPTPAPPAPENNDHGITNNAPVIGSTQRVFDNRQFGEIAFSFSDSQEKSAESVFKKPDNADTVSIVYETSAPDGEAIAKRLQTLLLSKQIMCGIGWAGIYAEFPGAPAYPGISFANVNVNNRAIADAIEAALKGAGAVKKPISRYEWPEPGPSQLSIVIRKP